MSNSDLDWGQKMKTASNAKGIRLGLAIALSLICLLQSAGQAEANPSAGFCRKDLVVREYLAPLTKYSSNAGFTESGRLASGPAVLRVFPPRSRLVAIGEPGGFESHGALAVHPSRSSLRWWVVSRLIRVGKRRGDNRVEKVRRQFIPTIRGFQGRNFGFGSKVHAGVYRLEIRFENQRGKVVNRYAEMFRALPARSDLRLVADQNPVQSGQRGYLRVDNYGTIAGTYFYEVRIWRADGSELSLGPQYVSNDQPIARPSYAGDCFQFPVPADTPAGEYKVGVLANDPLLSAPQLLTTKVSVGPAS
jgi:hypothetical protein